jgi:hypothetical protein
MGRTARNAVIPSRVVSLLDGPPKRLLADLGGKPPPENFDDTPKSRMVKRVVAGVNIEDHVPLPSRGGAGAKKYSKALGAMDVGDSFLMPGAKTASSIYSAKKDHAGKKFVCRPVSGGVRVWRSE